MRLQFPDGTILVVSDAGFDYLTMALKRDRWWGIADEPELEQLLALEDLAQIGLVLVAKRGYLSSEPQDECEVMALYWSQHDMQRAYLDDPTGPHDPRRYQEILKPREYAIAIFLRGERGTSTRARAVLPAKRLVGAIVVHGEQVDKATHELEVGQQFTPCAHSAWPKIVDPAKHPTSHPTVLYGALRDGWHRAACRCERRDLAE